MQLVAEGTLLTSAATRAVQSEVLAVARTAEESSKALSALAAKDAATSLGQRQLRQNLQEDARQALGESCLAGGTQHHMHEGYSVFESSPVQIY